VTLVDHLADIRAHRVGGDRVPFSAVFGIVVFDERLVHGSGRVVIAIAGLSLTVVGVVWLATSRSQAAATANRAPNVSKNA
jgi:hypothetical protein